MLFDRKQECTTLLELHHEDYSLYVTSPTQPDMRMKALELLGEESLHTEYGWSADAHLFVGEIDVPEVRGSANGNLKSANGQPVIFFENTDYQVEIEFSRAVSEAELVSPLFYDEKGDVVRRDSFMPRRKMLVFNINFGNDIGQSDIRVSYRTVKDGRYKSLQLHFDVMSSKLDYHKDLKLILEDIEREYSMLSMSFLRKTYQTFNTDINANEPPDLIWWNIFKSIQDEFSRAVAWVVERPHNRLCRKIVPQRADQLKRITPAIEREYYQHRDECRHLYDAEQWILNDDTPENRFVKFALQQITEKFSCLCRRIHQKNINTLPHSYAKELKESEDELRRLCSSSFLRRVGRFTGLKGENLTLKQASGYSTIYRDWLLLQSTYNLHDGIRRMELKDIAELYEIWCFIEVKNIVRQLLAERSGVDTADVDQKIPVSSTSYAYATPDMILRLNRGELSKIVLSHEDVALAEVIYNAQLGGPGSADSMSGMGDKVGSMTVNQRPDIVLRLTKDDVKNGIKLTYLFDAKYRIEVSGKHQTPPDDAINQMHRYRDAIYYSQKDFTESVIERNNLKREVLGGYILFPGKEPENADEENYLLSIPTVNIGAFPLRPSTEGASDRFLRSFLRKIIGERQRNLLLQSIPQHGLKYVDDAKPSPVLLIGFVKPEILDIVKKRNFYYIRAIKDGKSKKVISGFEKARFILLHDAMGDNRTLFRVNGSAQFYRGSDIIARGLNLKAQPDDVYIGYEVEEIPNKTEIGDIIFDADRINIPKKCFYPYLRTVNNPDYK